MCFGIKLTYQFQFPLPSCIFPEFENKSVNPFNFPGRDKALAHWQWLNLIGIHKSFLSSSAGSWAKHMKAIWTLIRCVQCSIVQHSAVLPTDQHRALNKASGASGWLQPLPGLLAFGPRAPTLAPPPQTEAFLAFHSFKMFQTLSTWSRNIMKYEIYHDISGMIAIFSFILSLTRQWVQVSIEDMHHLGPLLFATHALPVLFCKGLTFLMAAKQRCQWPTSRCTKKELCRFLLRRRNIQNATGCLQNNYDVCI